MMDSEAVVIGGGVTGLACAYGLSRAGRGCVVCEPLRPGGVIETRVIDGYQCELGPNVFLEKPGSGALLAELGLADEVIYPRVRRYGQYIWHERRACPLPKSFGQFLASPLIPGLEKQVLLRAAAALLLPGRLQPVEEDESVARFFRRVLGARTIARLVAPAMKGIYGGDVETLSARSIFPELWRHAASGAPLRGYLQGKVRGRAFVLRRGAGSLIRALVRALPPDAVRQACVTALRPASDGAFEVELAGQESIRAQRVFVATSGPASAAFLESSAPELAAALAALRYAALIVVHAAVPRTAPIHADGFGVLFPGSAPQRLLGVMYNSELFPHLAPPEGHLLTICFGGVGAQEYCAETDKFFAHLAVTELAEKLGIREARVLAVTRWPHAIPQPEVGHYRLVELMRNAERRFPGLHFIGSDTGAIAVPERAARAISAANAAPAAQAEEAGMIRRTGTQGA